jgi:hypothetical protein
MLTLATSFPIPAKFGNVEEFLHSLGDVPMSQVIWTARRFAPIFCTPSRRRVANLTFALSENFDAKKRSFPPWRFAGADSSAQQAVVETYPLEMALAKLR